MRRLLALLCPALLAAAPAELFNGKNLAGWELVATPAAAIAAACHYHADGSLAVAGQPVGYLTTFASHENFRLHAEWRWPAKPGNSGLLVHIASGPMDHAWPRCFQIQMKNKNVGDLLPMAGATFAEKLTTAPGASPAILARSAANSEKPAGEWNSADITCRDGTIEVTINGVPQNRATACTPRAGKIGFQFEGAPFELRAVRLTPL